MKEEYWEMRTFKGGCQGGGGNGLVPPGGLWWLRGQEKWPEEMDSIIKMDGQVDPTWGFHHGTLVRPEITQHFWVSEAVSLVLSPMIY